MTDFSWLLPVASEAYSKREELISIWDKINAVLRGQKRTIGFTGMPGVGKTVLFEHLSGTAYKAGYKPPLTSQKLETGKMPSHRERITLLVVPGQHSPPRREAMEKLFTGKAPVDGIVHVVANGYTTIRNETERASIAKDFDIETIEALRQHHLKAELEDLKLTCELIRNTVNKHHKPAWLLVAVTKTDLFYTSMETVKQYYSPFGKSEFVDVIKNLQGRIGSDNFRWDALPVCAWPEDFTWNTETQASTFKPNQRDHYLAEFAKHLERYCES